MFRFLALLCFAATAAWAQTGLATLTGTITDPSGAVIAGAPVSAQHLATGTVLAAATSSTGNYTISNMPIGAYELAVELPGFKSYRRSGITLILQQTLRLDIALEVGSQAESITVTSETSLLKTESGEVVHNITMREIQNLPITPVGAGIRDPFSVAQLIPGVRYGAFPNNFMLVNGLPQEANQFRIEGQVMGNARAGFTANTQQVQPSVDAIEQVAIVTSNYAAEYGSVAGALFNVTMRSGTRQLHGSVYDYAVNEVLNAHDPSVHLRDKLRRHDWGATFGGPLYIPKLYEQKNKTFFFFAWERYNQRQVAQVSATTPTVPIQAYRDGDFSRLIQLSGNQNLRIGTGAAARDYRDPLGNTIQAGTIFDPASTTRVACNTALSQDCTAGAQLDLRQAFPGNRIPVSLFDPVAKAIQDKYIPLPQGPRATTDVFNNYLNPFTATRLSIIPSVKIDHNFGAKTRLNAYWQMTKTEAPVSTTFGAEGFNDTITSNRGTYQAQTRGNLNLDHTVAPTLNFHLGIGWSHFDWADAALVTNYVPSTDIGLKGGRLDRTFPRFAANTQTTAGGTQLGGMSAMGIATQGLNPERRPAANTNLTWTHKNHTLKAGAEWRMDILPTISYSNTAGNFGALGNGITWQPSLLGLTLSGNANVGNAYAEFLLGSVRGFTMSTPIAYRTSKHQWGIFVQDTWRARRNLTIDYGLRWDLGTYTKEDHGRNAGLSLTVPNPSADGRPGGLIYEATCKCRFAQNYPYGLGPRLGFAYTLNSKTVLRGGFAITYGSTGTFGGFASNSATAQTATAGLDNFKLRDGIPSSINPQWPVFDAALGHTPGTVIGAQALLDQNAGRPSRTYQWNFALQRELTRNLVLETSYVANRGIWQDAGGLVSLNAVSEQQLSRYGFTVGNLDDATMLNAQVRNLTAAQQSTLRSRGVALPYASFPTTQTLFQSLRAYPQYSSGISPSSSPLGRSWYDALQVVLNKRFSGGLQINANYTWSKNLSATSLPDVFNRNYDNKDLAGFNLPQRIRVSFEYQTPKPSVGTPIVGNRWVAFALGNWGIAMRLSYQTAFYLNRPAAGATNGINRWLQRGPGGAQLKKDADGNYMNPWSVDWVDSAGTRRTDPLNIDCHCFDPEKTLVFNPAVWESVPDAQWGAQTSVLTFLRANRLPQEDANLSRSFRLTENGRFNLQIRVEFQNVFNRLRMPSPQISGLNFNTAPVRSADGRYTSGFGTFGNLRTPNTFGAERTGMFVGRLTF